MSSRDFARQVWCVLGVPIDCLTTAELDAELLAAARRDEQLFLSTPNLNYVATSRRDVEFRESLIDSDLSIADGMPLLWVARLLKLPIRERLAGSDFTQRLLNDDGIQPPLDIFFFGGETQAAERACAVINARRGGFRALGYVNPGFGSLEEMSAPQFIDAVNEQNPDLLSVSLGAYKGQLWVHRNRHKLHARIVSHLGAVINFFAGTVQRAPPLLRNVGLEWLWRIIQEPALWRRYARDGIQVLQLVVTRTLPYAVWMRLPGAISEPPKPDLSPLCELQRHLDRTRIVLGGSCTVTNLGSFTSAFQDAIGLGKPCELDFSKVTEIDARFIGMLFLLRKNLRQQGVTILHTTPYVRRLLHWNCVDYLLDAE